LRRETLAEPGSSRAHVLQRTSLRDARCVLRQVAPPDHAGHFSERLGVLSRHYQYNDHRANYPNVCPSRICAGTGLIPSTSALVLGSPLPRLRRDRAWRRFQVRDAREAQRDLRLNQSLPENATIIANFNG